MTEQFSFIIAIGASALSASTIWPSTPASRTLLERIMLANKPQAKTTARDITAFVT